MPIQSKTVLVSFDLTYPEQSDYDTIYEVLKRYGLERKVFNDKTGKAVILPRSTVIGLLLLGESSNEETVHRDLLEKFVAAKVPVERLVIAFVDVFSLYGWGSSA